MGDVYKARDTRLTRRVAIKVLPADATSDASARARFEREARATLSHPHICVVYDVGHQDGIDCLVMERLEGETLAERIARANRPLPLDEVLRIGTAIADALDKAHRAGIVHRDLKPLNVMLTKSGPKLLDFGLAKLHGAASPVSLSNETNATTAGPGTAMGTILGTIHYMSPEQLEGRDANTRSEIWALGAVLPAISPDGATVAFWAPDTDGVYKLWIRELSEPTARPLPGTDAPQENTGSRTPTWSPDSRSLAFFSRGTLQRIDVSGGSPIALADTGGSPRGLTWGSQGTILFVPNSGGGVFSVADSGGPPTSLPLGPLSRVAEWPSYLPDTAAKCASLGTKSPRSHQPSQGECLLSTLTVTSIAI